MSTAESPARDDLAEPIVVSCSASRDGVTYGLDLSVRRRLKQRFGDAVHAAPRIFIAHDSAADFAEIHGPARKQIILLLTGLSEDRLKELGPVEFRDPVTEGSLVRVEAGRL